MISLMTKETKTKIEDLSFEEALIELEGIVRSLEGGSVKLDEALVTYERGVELKNYCQKKLGEAKLRIEKITLNTKGEPQGTEPFIEE